MSDTPAKESPMAHSWKELVERETAYALCSDKEGFDQARAMTAAALAGIEPKDCLETMLASLLIATHDAALGCFQRATREKAHSYRCDHLALGGKLARSYALLLDALDRRRGRGTQTIRIERVNIEPGARALVGILNEAPGGGVEAKSESRSYETGNTDASPPLPAMRSEDKARDDLQVTGDAQRPLPDTRREGRCSDGQQE